MFDSYIEVYINWLKPNFRVAQVMAMAKESMAKSLSEFANALESEEVEPRILREVEILIRKFPTAEALTSLKTTSPITKRPPEIWEEILE